MKVLLTGASGFTGRYMAELLINEGHAVVPLKSNLLDVVSLKAEVKDVCPDWVVHLGALSFVGHQDEEAFYRVNVFGTLNLLQAIYESEKWPNKILVASSANVYGNINQNDSVDVMSFRPVNHYACSKLSMEFMVRNWFDILPIIITRPFNYTGPLQDKRFLVPKLVHHFVCKAQDIELGNTNVVREFNDVRDVCEVYLRLLNSNYASGIVDVSSARGASLKSLVLLLEQLTSHSLRIRTNQELIRSNDIEVLVGNSSGLESLIGAFSWRDLSVTLGDMIKTVHISY